MTIENNIIITNQLKEQIGSRLTNIYSDLERFLYLEQSKERLSNYQEEISQPVIAWINCVQTLIAATDI